MTLPIDFQTYTRALLGDARYDALAQALAEEPTVSIRLNTHKADSYDVHTSWNADDVPWCAAGRYLEQRPNFTFDPLLHAGQYYVQEASSMFLHHILTQVCKEPVVALDLCAAPGGKSMVARAALPAGSLLFANEPIRLRAHILSENLCKYGHPDVIVTTNEARAYRKARFAFDVIIADVPCSGEGMFRKDKEAIAAWSAQQVEKCSELQRTIIADIWDCLKPGGVLVYSTCTFNAHENEENVAWIARELGAEFIKVPVDAAWVIAPSLVSGVEGYRFLPGSTKGEGLFISVLRKTSDSTLSPQKARKTGKTPYNNKVVNDWLSACTPTAIYPKGDMLWAIPQTWASLFETACEQLNVVHAGVILGAIKGRDVLPHAALALSTLLRREAFCNVALTYEQAIAYLRKETLVLSADTPHGIVLLTFENAPLGFAKNIGSRANNLYPAEWKIKSTHVPPSYVPVLARETGSSFKLNKKSCQ